MHYYYEEPEEYEETGFVGFFIYTMFILLVGMIYCSFLYDPEMSWIHVILDFLGDLL